MKSLLKLALLACTTVAFAACSGIDAGGTPKGSDNSGDPLDVSFEAPPGSLDALHVNIVAKSCAAQPGLCHSGQFEPNMSTPALMYENLARRPSLEHPKQLRIEPGAPEKSLIIDKLRNHQVISQMPLGAAPLAESDIEAIEAWIKDGAPRRPGDQPAPVLNNLPDAPRIGVFDSQGNKLNADGPFSPTPGEKLTFRMTVKDFETADADMSLAGFYLQTADQMTVVFNPNDPAYGAFGLGTYDPKGAPVDAGDPMSWRFDYVLPDSVMLADQMGNVKTVPTAGLDLTVIALYADGDLTQGGMLAYSFELDLLQVKQ